MIRLILLSAVVILVGVHAWRDWYKSLCGLVVLMALLEHPDMPKTMFGIQGLNLWNLLLFVIILAWAAQRRGEGLTWDLPRASQLLLISFLLIVTIACLRLIADRQALVTEASLAGLISEYFVNPIKFIIPGVLLFDGCRSRSRFVWGLISILSLYLLLSVQIIRWMPMEAIADPSMLAQRSQKILRAEVGYYRVDLSVMLAGASWALLAAQSLVVSSRRRFLLVIAVLLIVFAGALTAGRSGYFAWVVTGLSLSLLRWPRYLVLMPVVGVVLAFMPGIAGRAFEGISASSDTSSLEDLDVDTLTAGRSNVWPAVLEKIADAPLVGYGRRAMERIGLSRAIEGEEFIAHPHNAYLEALLENGWIGLAVILALFGYIVGQSVSLTRDGRSPVFVAVGGVTAALVIAQLAGSVTAQSFYPREGTVGMWCAVGLMLRVAVERARGNLRFGMLAPATPQWPLEWWRCSTPRLAGAIFPASCRGANENAPRHV